ncbi:hypothetical protein PBY51_010192 [Eleginops maclovinus]|uniref:Uncharacterized protein n=1 Tax=Eleginops maclovinus TaxID=56733 RepID=A0AAN7X9S0_ELEMC|nr:hypothetical protein PBY51_010192 [Eleginops maclovinus]
MSAESPRLLPALLRGPKAFLLLSLHPAGSIRFRQLLPLWPDSTKPPNAIIQQPCPQARPLGEGQGEGKVEGYPGASTSLQK